MSFWEERWREGRIGFHEGAPNVYLQKHASRLAGPRVLVPLCGKSEDLAYLASRGHEVVGIELVEDAVRAFFDEHGLTPTVTSRGAVTSYAAGGVELLAGDLFAVTADDVGEITSIYDRAALIALPAELRQRYVDHLRVLAPGAAVLLVSLEYPQDQHAGPPFAVMPDEVATLYVRSERLDEALASGPISQRGITVIERCYAAAL